MKEASEKNNCFSRLCFRILRRLVLLFYPKIGIEGVENLPDEPCVIVANHTQMNGPIVCELYLPNDRAIWCASPMMYLKEVPAYAYQDFWSAKPKAVRWFYKLLSYVIAPLSVCVFNNAHTIPVFRDTRLITTFRRSMERLDEGANVVVFPECAQPHNQIVNTFQEKFIELARLYYKRTGKELCFVPMYIAPKLKTMYLGAPVRYDSKAPTAEERRRICECMMERITEMAVKLPRHTVVPYSNMPKKQYPMNIPEGTTCEKTCR